MRQKTLVKIFEALNRENVRYLVAGGLAVVAHGYLRFTADLDLVLDMDEENLSRAMQVFESIGYRARAPVTLMDFVDSEKRKRWAREKNLTVFSLWSEKYPFTEIDIFVDPPIAFEDAYKSRVRLEVADKVDASFIGFDELIHLKKKAARPRDLEDIERLKTLREDQTNG